MSDSYRIVGAPGLGDTGSVLVFDMDATQAPISTIVPFQGALGDEFGAAVAASGDLVLVGAPLHELNGVLGGSSFLYRFDADQGLWLQEDDFGTGEGKERDEELVKK